MPDPRSRLLPGDQPEMEPGTAQQTPRPARHYGRPRPRGARLTWLAQFFSNDGRRDSEAPAASPGQSRAGEGFGAGAFSRAGASRPFHQAARQRRERRRFCGRNKMRFSTPPIFAKLSARWPLPPSPAATTPRSSARAGFLDNDRHAAGAG